MEGSVTKEVYVPAPLRQAGVRVVVQWGRYDAWLGAQSDAGDEARARQALELLKRQALRHPVPYVSPKEVVEAFARSGSLCMRHIGQVPMPRALSTGVPSNTRLRPTPRQAPCR